MVKCYVCRYVEISISPADGTRHGRLSGGTPWSNAMCVAMLRWTENPVNGDQRVIAVPSCQNALLARHVDSLCVMPRRTKPIRTTKSADDAALATKKYPESVCTAQLAKSYAAHATTFLVSSLCLESAWVRST